MPEGQRIFGVHIKNNRNKPTQLLNRPLQLVQVRLVLSLVLDLFFDTLQDTHSGGVVVDLTGTSERGVNDLGGRDEIVCKAIVQASLQLEEVVARGEKILVAGVECLEGFGLVCVCTPGRETNCTYRLVMVFFYLSRSISQ